MSVDVISTVFYGIAIERLEGYDELASVVDDVCLLLEEEGLKYSFVGNHFNGDTELFIVCDDFKSYIPATKIPKDWANSKRTGKTAIKILEEIGLKGATVEWYLGWIYS